MCTHPHTHTHTPSPLHTKLLELPAHLASDLQERETVSITGHRSVVTKPLTFLPRVPVGTENFHLWTPTCPVPKPVLTKPRYLGPIPPADEDLSLMGLPSSSGAPSGPRTKPHEAFQGPLRRIFSTSAHPVFLVSVAGFCPVLNPHSTSLLSLAQIIVATSRAPPPAQGEVMCRH